MSFIKNVVEVSEPGSAIVVHDIELTAEGQQSLTLSEEAARNFLGAGKKQPWKFPEFKTWMYESLIVGCILATVALLSSNPLVEWIGALAVFCAFNYAQIADRLAERQKFKTQPDVPCYWKMQIYFVAKEILWLSYFLLHRSYAALVGVGIFLLYPLWRKLWRKYNPIPPALFGFGAQLK